MRDEGLETGGFESESVMSRYWESKARQGRARQGKTRQGRADCRRDEMIGCGLEWQPVRGTDQQGQTSGRKRR